jgi:hypothetical protein
LIFTIKASLFDPENEKKEAKSGKKTGFLMWF